MKAQFADTFADGRDIARIALRQSIDAIGESGTGSCIPYRAMPAREYGSACAITFKRKPMKYT